MVIALGSYLQGTVLAPTIFTIYIDGIDVAAAEVSTIKKFTDDTKLGQEIKEEEERKKLQTTLDNLV